MALGYEGYIKLGTHWVLGTGASVPRNRARLDSASGYGGKIKSPPTTKWVGIGSPHTYDWNFWNGSLNFDVNKSAWIYELRPWLFDRQSPKEINIASRRDNVQQFTKAYLTSMGLSAAEGGAVDGSIEFVAIERDTYTFGDKYIDNKFGKGLLCPPGDFPKPLNAAPPGKVNWNPVPFWNTQIWVSGVQWFFISWSLDISQDMVPFFGCTDTSGTTPDPGPQEPKYIAAGPMSVSLSGTILENVLVDAPSDVRLFIADQEIVLNRVEVQTQSDDVQTGESLVVQNVEYSAFELDRP